MTANFSNALSNATNDTVDLSQIDPRDFRDHDRWFRLMVRCFHVGVSRDDFVRWCCSDPAYADHVRKVGQRWDSLARKNSGQQQEPRR